ncbi:zinc finger protein 585A-like isoform X1 [Pleurodeles waltl]|uniref:zinc finger protein 585A-like isoform X1 n=1 Tax=Pleurodeles waltl TaxID=8319 RepID=UPI003709582A
MTETVEMPDEQFDDFLSMIPLDLVQEDVVLNEIWENNPEAMKVLTENPYPCRICAKSFRYASSLRWHRTTHTAYRQDTCEESENCAKATVFACVLCDHEFESYPDLLKHCKVHKKGGRFSCTECEKTFERFGRLEYHLKVHKGKTSSTPSAVNATETSLQIQFKENKTKISFICTECGECFTSYKRVLKHQKINTALKLVRDLETDESGTLGVQHLINSETQMRNPLLSCTWCGEVFVQKEELQAHQETQKCESNFSQTEHVATHQSIPKGERCQERLQESGGSFIQTQPLVNEQSLHAGLKCQEESCTFSCSRCNKIFRTKQHLLTHQKIHSSAKPFTCEECGKVFIQKGYLLCHQKIHCGEKIQRKRHTCLECGKSFCKKVCLKKHQEKHLRHGHYLGTEQGKEKTPFNSTDCDQKGTGVVDLQICQQKNEEEEHFTCSGCGRKFMYRKSFLNHQKACVCEQGSIDIEQVQETLKEGPYTCRGCGRKFTYQKSYLKHLKAYLRKGLYMCGQHKTEAESFAATEGDQSFTDKMDIGQNHKKQEKEQHCTCRGCGQMFTSPESFLKHQEAYSREGLYLCAKNSVEHGPLNESECDQRFTDLENPQEKQEDGQNCTCVGCGRKFTYQKSFQKHLKAYLRKGLYMCGEYKTVAESFAATEGDQSFTNKMDIGQNPEKQEQEQHCTCRGCGQTFTNRESFLKHQEAYSREGLYLCAKNSVEHGPLNKSEYDQRFTDLENPQEKQEDGQNCTCVGCGRKFTYHKSFLKHQESYLRKGVYLCTKNRAENEPLTDSDLGQSVTNLEKQQEKQDGQNCTCGGCGRKFTYQKSYLKHQKFYFREGLHLCTKDTTEN